MLDSITRAEARRVPRRQRERQRRPRDAMHGDWTTTGVGDLDPTDEVVEWRRRVVLENDLHGADLERLGEPLRGQRRAPSYGDPLRQRTAAYRVDERTQVADAVVRCRVGDAGDPEAGQPLPDSAEIGHALEREHVSQPSVEAEQPTRRTTRSVAFHAFRRPGRGGPFDDIERCRVEHPHRTAAVLNPQWAMRHDGVEELAVEQSGNRLVVAHGADPRPSRMGSIGFAAARRPAMPRRARRADRHRPTSWPRPSPAGGCDDRADRGSVHRRVPRHARSPSRHRRARRR